MLKKLILAMFCLSVVCIPLTVQAKDYPKDHAFFDYDFWEKATKEDVKKAIKKGYNINTIYDWEPEPETTGNAPTFDGENILAAAAGMFANPAALEVLIKNGATIDAGVMRNANDLATIKMFVKYGGNVNALTRYNETILHHIPYMETDMVKFILDNGAITNIKNVYGDTPMSELVEYFNPNTTYAQNNKDLLEESGATLENGKYPRELGLPKYKVKKNTLKKYTKKHNFHNLDFWRVATLKDVQQSLIPGEALSTANTSKYYDKILSNAFEYNSDPKVIELLLKNGAVIDEQSADVAGRNPNVKMLAVLLKHLGDSEKDLELGEMALSSACDAGLKDNILAIFKKWPKFEEMNPYDIRFYFESPSEARPDRKEALKLFKGYKP